jgi:hypothetical protein
MSCFDTLRIEYALDVTEPHRITIAWGGSAAADFACPSPEMRAGPIAGGGRYVYMCEAGWFSIVMGLGRPSADASPITMDVAIATAGGAVIVPRTQVVATASAYSPNGPICGPTCYAYRGSIGGRDR